MFLARLHFLTSVIGPQTFPQTVFLSAVQMLHRVLCFRMSKIYDKTIIFVCFYFDQKWLNIYLSDSKKNHLNKRWFAQEPLPCLVSFGLVSYWLVKFDMVVTLWHVCLQKDLRANIWKASSYNWKQRGEFEEFCGGRVKSGEQTLIERPTEKIRMRAGTFRMWKKRFESKNKVWTLLLKSPLKF